MSWWPSPSLKKPDPKVQLEQEILRQWERRRQVDRLAAWPVHQLLRRQLRQKRRQAENAKMDLLPVHRRLTLRIGNAIGSAKSASVHWLIRRRCLQPARRMVIKLIRRLVLKVLEILVQEAFRQYLGKLKNSLQSLARLSTVQKRIEWLEENSSPKKPGSQIPPSESS